MDTHDSGDRTKPLLVTRDARGVVTFTLNRPGRFNALSDALLAALDAAIGAVAADAAARRLLINEAVPDDELDAAVERRVAGIIAKPREALAIGKAQFYQQIELGVADAYRVAGAAMACNMAERSARAGISSFLGRNK